MSRALRMGLAAGWLLACPWLVGGAVADAAGSVSLLVRETAGVERGPWPVCGGIGLPDGLLPVSAVNDGLVTLTDAEGSRVPCQARVLAEWPAAGAGGPHARRLLVAFLGSVAAGAEARYDLGWTKETPGDADETSPVGVAVADMAGARVVRNGAGAGAMMLVVDGHRGRGVLESVAIDEAGDGFPDDLPLIGDRRPATSSVSYADAGRHRSELGLSVPDVAVEESGPVRAVVRVRSEYDARVSMVHRLIVYSGLPAVFVQTTLYVAPGRGGAAGLRLLGHTTSLPLGILESADVSFGGFGADAFDEGQTSVVPGKPLVIRSGPGSAGFSATLGGEPLVDVPAPLGWVEAACRGRRVVLGLGGLPSRPPQRLEIGGGHLVMDFCASELSLAPGQSLTEEYLLYFPADLAVLGPADAARAFAEPLHPAVVTQGAEGAGGTPPPAAAATRSLPEWGEARYEARLEEALTSARHHADELAEGRGAAPSADWVRSLLWEFERTADPRWLGAARGIAVRLCDGRPASEAEWLDAVSACAELTGDGRLQDSLRSAGSLEP